MADRPVRHIDSIPFNWAFSAPEMQAASTWQEWEDDRPLDSAPLLDGLAEGLQAAKDRIVDEVSNA